jgi:hypothetical protein
MAKSGNVCPLMRGKCIETRCMWWVQLRVTNKNTGQEVDEGGCAISFMPMLMIETANVQRQTGAAIESLRNENIRGEDMTRKVLMTGMGMFEPANRQALIEEDKSGRS